MARRLGALLSGALRSRWAAAAAVWLAAGWATMITWHAGTLLLHPEALRDGQYALVLFFGAGAGFGVGIVPAMMAAGMIRRAPAFRSVALRLVLVYSLALLAAGSAVDALRAGTLVTIAAIPVFAGVLLTLPAAVAGSLMTPAGAVMGAAAVTPLTVMLLVAYRSFRRVR